ncbi:MAG: phosphoribosylaminoimidazolesuccinocarboxamide synthase [bacterium]|nr:phosphoribosylaminoimidazolesuccinocarboxamide synthase [bacterium]
MTEASHSIPEPFYRGKVRDLYPVAGDSGAPESMIIVASDRISAFDVVFDEAIPGKGRILNSISTAWFRALRKSGLMQSLSFSDQVLAEDVADFPVPYRDHADFRGRAVQVRRTDRVDFECVVRGYLAGSGWKDYRSTGAVCGHTLPAGLRQAEKLPQPLFTPATKAELGDHDENVSVAAMRAAVGEQLTNRLENISIAIYEYARDLMAPQGIYLCDTKFEFGLIGDEIVLIDEALTPDSSRYWNADSYEIGGSPPGFDKQYIRDYLETQDWNKRPPAPALPDEVIERTIGLYREIEARIGRALENPPTAAELAARSGTP